MDIFIERGGPQYATSSEYQNKTILVDVTYTDPQAGVTYGGWQR